MNEAQIEARAERQLDALDRLYLTTGLEHSEYTREVARIEREVKDALAAIRKSNVR